MRRVFLLVVAVLIQLSAFSQKNLTKRLAAADTIYLVKHKPTGLYAAYPNMTAEDQRNLNIVVNGRPNYKIIQHKVPLNPKDLKKLTSILTKPADGHLNSANCYIPRHAILIIREQHISFIDLCFQCKDFESSKQLAMEKYDFDDNKWQLLENLFASYGLMKE